MYLKALVAIHHQGIRLCLGALRTSPVDSLYVEANEPPLDLPILKLNKQYIVNLKANIDNPAIDCVLNPKFKIYTKKIKKLLDHSALESIAYL